MILVEFQLICSGLRFTNLHMLFLLKSQPVLDSTVIEIWKSLVVATVK